VKLNIRETERKRRKKGEMRREGLQFLQAKRKRDSETDEEDEEDDRFN
jgi:hypothetical protein